MKNLKCDEVVPETKFVTEHDKKNRGNPFSIIFEMQEKIFGFTVKQNTNYITKIFFI